MADPAYACKCYNPSTNLNNNTLQGIGFTNAQELYRTHSQMHPTGTADLTAPVAGLYLARAYAAFASTINTSPELRICFGPFSGSTFNVLNENLAIAYRPSPVGTPSSSHACLFAFFATAGPAQVFVAARQNSSISQTVAVEFSLRRVSGL